MHQDQTRLNASKAPRLSGFAESVGSAYSDTRPLGDLISLALERAHQHSAKKLKDLNAARAKTETARRAAHRMRLAKILRWAEARTKLLAVVLSVDKAIRPNGMSLSMGDFDAHVVDLASVQVQLAVLGRPSRSTLEITVFEDYRQQARIIHAEMHVSLAKLPAIPQVDQSHYANLVLCYIEAALPDSLGKEDLICRKCGIFVPCG